MSQRPGSPGELELIQLGRPDVAEREILGQPGYDWEGRVLEFFDPGSELVVTIQGDDSDLMRQLIEQLRPASAEDAQELVAPFELESP